METARLRIAALAPNSWFGMWMNRQQLLSRLAHRHGVLYCTGPLNVWSRSGSEWKNSSHISTVSYADGVAIDQPGKLTARWPTLDIYDRFAVRHAAKRWQAFLEAMDGDSRIAYVFHPDYFPYVRHLEFDKLIYHPYDLFSKTRWWGEERAASERELLQRADAVLTINDSVAAELQRTVNRPVSILPNGVDYESFADDSLELPDEYQNIAKPRIGYVGRINVKVDLDLLTALAERHPEFNIVLVGPVAQLGGDLDAAMRRAKNLTNMHFLGPRHHTELPRFVAHLDVGLLCYRTGARLWSDVGYPLKLHEYLAAGLPIVSADMPSVRPFSSVVRFAHGLDEWSDSILAALSSRLPADLAERRAIAERHSWDAISRQLEEILLAA